MSITDDHIVVLRRCVDEPPYVTEGNILEIADLLKAGLIDVAGPDLKYWPTEAGKKLLAQASEAHENRT